MQQPSPQPIPLNPELTPPPQRRRPWTRPDQVLRLLAALGVLAIGITITYYFFTLVLYLLLGLVASYIVRPLVDRIQGLGTPRVLAIMLSFGVIFSVTSLLLTYLVPILGARIGDFTQNITEDIVNSWAASLETNLRAIIPAIKEGALLEGISELTSGWFQEREVGQVLQALLGVFTDIFYALIIIPFVAFFFLRDGGEFWSKSLRLVPNRYFEVTLNLVEKIELNLGRYFKGLLLQTLAVSAVATFFLSFTGLKYPLVIGLFTGLANNIPYFGPLVGFIAGTLVGFGQTGDFSLIFGLAVAMGLTQLIDNAFFQPFIFSRAARLHPLVVLFVVLIGNELADVPGMLLAIPVTATIRVTVEQVFWSIRNYRILAVN